VAPTDCLVALRQEADDVVCLEEHEVFGAIGLYYSDFLQISDEEVIETLGRFSTCKRERQHKPAA
jgi:predicted phosphoribosyltransferase